MQKLNQEKTAPVSIVAVNLNLCTGLLAWHQEEKHLTCEGELDVADIADPRTLALPALLVVTTSIECTHKAFTAACCTQQSCLCFPSPCGSTGVTDTIASGFYVGSVDSRSGPWTCMASIVTNDPPPQHRDFPFP